MNAKTQIALLAAAFGLAPKALAVTAAATADELSAIEVHPSERGGTVVLRGSHSPVFSVFRLSEPDRIIVDLAGADVSKAKAPEHGGIQGVGEISAVQFQKGDTRVGRVVLNADPALTYDVKVVGNDVVIALSGGLTGELHPLAPAKESPMDSPTQSGLDAKAPLAAVASAAPVAPVDEHLIERVSDKGHAGHHGHRVLGATSRDQKTLALTIRTDGPVGDLTLLRLKAPNRVAVDLAGFESSGAKGQAGGAASDIRFGKSSGGARIVFDLSGAETPEVTLQRTSTGLSIAAKSEASAPKAVAAAARVAPSAADVAMASPAPRHEKSLPAAQAADHSAAPAPVAGSSQKVATTPAPVVAVAPAPVVAPAPSAAKVSAPPAIAAATPAPTRTPAPVLPPPITHAAPTVTAQVSTASAPPPAVATATLASSSSAKRPKPSKAGVAEVRDLRVSGDGAVQEIVLELPAGTKLGSPKSVDGNGYELQLHGVSVPEKLRRTLDATAFNGPVATVSSFNVGQGEGRVVVSAAAGTRQELKQDGSTVTWRFSRPIEAAAAEVSIDGAKVASMQTDQGETQVAGFTTAAAETANELPRRTHYTGRRISLEFKDIDIQNLLRLFADISHKNIVVADNVKGKVTIALRNVPWDQAFDLILKTHGLGKEESGNIVRVAPEEELEKERKAALEAKKARDLLEPLRVRLIPVNYALAGDVSDKIKDVLSERGVVTVDGRTNVLIVKDVPDNLAKAEGMVRNLDTQTPQVLIESRIVEASTQFNRQVGIQWGGNGGFAPVNANSTGLVFPSTATVAGAAGGTPNAGTAANPNFAVNLPAAIGQGAGGGLGFIFGSAGGAVNLNLRISALESNGIVKTVSAPKVATLDNQEATISQGVSIPFAQVSAAGVQTAFIEARLELKVTPHVTSDGSVLMKISATNNQPNAGITGANGQPSISRKEAKTQMLVRDGDTSVIGGIYTRSTGVSVNQVPLFGNIPILGWLFKTRSDSDQRTELLIFITPRILNRQQIVASGN